MVGPVVGGFCVEPGVGCCVGRGVKQGHHFAVCSFPDSHISAGDFSWL